MQLDARDAVAQVDQRRAGISADHAVAGAERSDARQTRCSRDWLVTLCCRIVTLRAMVAVPGCCAAGQHRLDHRADALTRLLHALHGVGDAHRVPHFKRSHLPVEAGAHGAVDAGGGVGDLRQAVRRVVPQPRQQLPVEARCLVLLLIPAQKHPQPLRQRLRVLRHFERRQLRLRRRLILERLQVQHQADVLAIRAALLLVEAAAGLVAQPLALEHGFEKRRQRRLTACILLCFGEVPRHMRQDVEPHHVRQPEGAGARPADGGAGQRVHLLDGQVFFLHHAQRLQDDEDADAVGDEVRRVAREDDFLAEVLIGEAGKRLHRRRIGVRSGNDLHQPHVARRIEEVRAEPAAAQARQAARPQSSQPACRWCWWSGRRAAAHAALRVPAVAA